MNTHIWETPVPEPQDGEYTLPASMKKQLGTAGPTLRNQPDSEDTGICLVSQRLPLNVNQSQNSVKTNIQAQCTMPVKCGPDQPHVIPTVTHVDSEYTMPVKMSEQTNPVTTTSDYTIPVLPQPVPDTPESESEYTMPTAMNVPDQKQNIPDGRSSLQEIL